MLLFVEAKPWMRVWVIIYNYQKKETQGVVNGEGGDISQSLTVRVNQALRINGINLI